ncbi:MAG: hypothetical protein ACAH88_21425 [Roseimicrobium sp.]
MHHEEPSLSPTGGTSWTAAQGFTQECKTQLPWTFDEEGNMQLVTEDASALSAEAKGIIDEDLTPPAAPAPNLHRLFQRAVALAKS